MAAPDAGAVSACSTMAGKNYAILLSGSEYFNVAGGEPGSLTPVPNPVSGLGAITINADCQVSGELVYNDNDTVQGPAGCTPGGTSLAFGGVGSAPLAIPVTAPIPIPCFNGETSGITGTVALNSAGQGPMTFTASFNNCWTNSASPATCTPTPVTFNFEVSDGLGSGTFTGTSLADVTQDTTPPQIGILGEKQGTAATTGIANTTYGNPPWVGETNTLGQDQSGGTSDSATCPGCGGTDGGLNLVDKGINNANCTAAGTPFGCCTGAGTGTCTSSIQAGGTIFADDNNSIVFLADTIATEVTSEDCHYQLSPDTGGGGPFTDGTSNIAAVFLQPEGASEACTAANTGFGFSLSTVIWGATNNYNFSATTGGTSGLSNPGAYSPPGTSGHLSSNPALAGKPVKPITVTATKAGVYLLHFTNTSPLDCIVNLSPSIVGTVCAFGQEPGALNDQPTLELPVWCPNVGNAQCTGSHTPYSCCTGSGAGSCVPAPPLPDACTAAGQPASCCTAQGTGTGCTGNNAIGVSDVTGLPITCAFGTNQYVYLNGSSVGTTEAFDVYPGYNALVPTGDEIFLDCPLGKPATTGNTITITSPNCAELNGQTFTVNN